jgi:hypothetical protein
MIFRMAAENPTWGAPRILCFNVTRNPNAFWIGQQLRESWPYMPMPRFLLFDRDSKFGTDVISAVQGLGSQPLRTAFGRKAQHLLPVILARSLSVLLFGQSDAG